MQSNIFLLVGDPFLIEEKEKPLFAHLHEQISGEVSRVTYQLSDTPFDKILAEARTLPFLSAAQIFRLRNTEVLKKNEIALLAAFLEHPPQHAYFFLEAALLERSAPLAKLVAEKGEVFFLDEREKKNAGIHFIKEKLGRFGKTMPPETIVRLEEQTQAAPAVLDSLLDQLIAYAGDKTQITEEMVETFEEKWENPDVFKWTNAISGRRTGEALVLLRKFLDDNGEDVISLLGILHWQIRRFWKARLLVDQGVPENQMLEKLRISPKQAPYFLRQVRGFTLSKLEDSLEGLFQLDWKIKTGRVEGPAALEAWIVKATP